MNLGKKRLLAARALSIGKNRIVFRPDALAEIKEAITRQDIHSLFEDGKIMIKQTRGRKAVEKRSTTIMHDSIMEIVLR